MTFTTWLRRGLMSAALVGLAAPAALAQNPMGGGGGTYMNQAGRSLGLPGMSGDSGMGASEEAVIEFERNYEARHEARAPRGQLSQREGGVRYSWDSERQEWVVMGESGQQGRALKGARDELTIVVNEQARSRSLQGAIDGFQHVNLRGYDEKHTLVKLRLDDGQTTIVDLGAREDLSDLQLRKGDWLQVRGKQARIGQDQVVLAEQVRVEGITLILNHDHAMRAGKGEQGQIGQRQPAQPLQQPRKPEMTAGARSQAREERGSIEQVGTLFVGPDGKKHTLVRLRLDDGQPLILDLGDNTDVMALGVEEDNVIAVRGRMNEVNGMQVLEVDRIVILDPLDEATRRRAGGLRQGPAIEDRRGGAEMEMEMEGEFEDERMEIEPRRSR